jgi:hypothetical protein
LCLVPSKKTARQFGGLQDNSGSPSICLAKPYDTPPCNETQLVQRNATNCNEMKRNEKKRRK